MRRASTRGHGETSWVGQTGVTDTQGGNETCGQERRCFWAWEGGTQGGASGTVGAVLSSNTLSATLGNQGNTPCNSTGPSKKLWFRLQLLLTKQHQTAEAERVTRHISQLYPFLNVKCRQNHQAAISNHVPGLQCPVLLAFWKSSRNRL